MSTFSSIIFVADPPGWVLMIVVGGTMLVALVANVLALTAWLRRRP